MTVYDYRLFPSRRIVLEFDCLNLEGLSSSQTPAATLSSGLRKAAVLLPLLCDGDQWHLLFIRRTELVQDHKGQVSFPGGAFEPEDADLEAYRLA